MIRKKPLYFVQLAVSGILMFYFSYSLDIQESLHSIAPLGWMYVGLTALLVNLDRLLMSYKWNILLKAKGIALPFSEVLRSYYIGTFWGSFLPSTIGGDVVRALRISGKTGGSQDIVSSIILERVLGVLASFLICMVSAFVSATLLRNADLKIVAVSISAFLFLTALALISLNTRVVESLQDLVARKPRFLGYLIKVFHSYQNYRHHHRALWQVSLWSLLEQSVPILANYFVSQALGLNLPFLIFFVVIPMILALSKIPLSLDGFGISEGLYVYFFSFLGVPAAEAFLLGLIAHILGNVLVWPGFFYYSFCSPSSPALSRTHI